MIDGSAVLVSEAENAVEAYHTVMICLISCGIAYHSLVVWLVALEAETKLEIE